MSNSNHSSTPGALPPSQQTSASTETWITAAEAASIVKGLPNCESRVPLFYSRLITIVFVP